MPNDDCIKRSDALFELNSYVSGNDPTLIIAYRVDLCEIIENIPAADVEPVRRGKWEYDSDGVPNCSQCGEFALQRLHLYIKNKTFDAPFKLTDYCPNCGAKMDEEVKI